jgi:hypothetical protein
MHKYVGTAGVRLDKSKALRCIEPFHCADRHDALQLKRREPGRTSIHCKANCFIGSCAETLLDTHSPERSYVGDEVLEETARLTAVGTLSNPIAEDLRNFVGQIALGFAPVRNAFADQISQVSVGHPKSPMNGGEHRSLHPAPRQRMAPIAGSPPFNAGNVPRFTILASPSLDVTEVLGTYPGLLSDKLGGRLRQTGVADSARTDTWRDCAP